MNYHLIPTKLTVNEVFFFEDGRRIFVTDFAENPETMKLLNNFKGQGTLILGEQSVDTFCVYMEISFLIRDKPTWRAIGTESTLTVTSELIKEFIAKRQCYLELNS